VVQNPAATRVVEVLLGTSLLLTLLSWFLGPRRAILPRSPTSVASVLAMLVDGNVFSVWDEEGDRSIQINAAEIAKVFGNMRVFRLGTNEKDGNGNRFGIYVTDGNGLLKAIIPSKSDIDEEEI
jgi:hypothetical protein